MSDVIERAARAHYTCRARDLAKAYPARMGVAPVTWDDLPESVREIERGHMRAAIVAMLGPTAAMKCEGGARLQGVTHAAYDLAHDVFDAMLTAALNEGVKP